MGALYFGVGKALGSLVGGLAIEELGVRNTFRCFSMGSFVAASIYLCFTLLYERRMRMPRRGSRRKARRRRSLSLRGNVRMETLRLRRKRLMMIRRRSVLELQTKPAAAHRRWEV